MLCESNVTSKPNCLYMGTLVRYGNGKVGGSSHINSKPRFPYIVCEVCMCVCVCVWRGLGRARYLIGTFGGSQGWLGIEATWHLGS